MWAQRRPMTRKDHSLSEGLEVGADPKRTWIVREVRGRRNRFGLKEIARSWLFVRGESHHRLWGPRKATGNV